MLTELTITRSNEMCCDPTTPLDELSNLKWSVTALAKHAAEPGSCKGDVIKNAARGIEERIDWVMRTLQAAGEGKKNMGA